MSRRVSRTRVTCSTRCRCATDVRRDFRVPTWAMRIIVQRRLALGSPRPSPRRGPSLWRAHVHGARRSRSGSYGRFGEQYRARRPQPTPPADRVLRHSLCSSHAGRVGHAGRDGAAGSPRLLERLPARRLWPGARQGAHARGLSATSSSRTPSLPQRGGHVRAARCLRRLRGNTAPGTRADVFGLAQRGVKGTVAAGVVVTFRPARTPPAPATSRVQKAGLNTPTRCRARTRTC